MGEIYNLYFYSHWSCVRSLVQVGYIINISYWLFLDIISILETCRMSGDDLSYISINILPVTTHGAHLSDQSSVCHILTSSTGTSSSLAISSSLLNVKAALRCREQHPAAANHPASEEENIRSKSSVITQSQPLDSPHPWCSDSEIKCFQILFTSSRSIYIYGRAWEWTLTSLASRLLTTEHCLQCQGESEEGRNNLLHGRV